MISIQLNGQSISMSESISLFTFLKENNLAQQGGVAVALNQTVISQKDWGNKLLQNNDEIIIITATQGG